MSCLLYTLQASIPLVFIHVSGQGERQSLMGSRSNADEAKVLLSCLLYLHRHGKVPLSSIGVITPYVAQVQLICEKLAVAGIKANRAVLQEDEKGRGKTQGTI